MELVYKGKTKDVFRLEDGNLLLKFKDDMTGEDGVFDPGANKIGLTLEGAGKSGLRLTRFFFQKLEKEAIPSHYIDSDLEKATMTVLSAKFFGKGIEVICRYKASGSFIRRYGLYAEEGQDLDSYVEITLKDDERNDPLITEDGLEALGILTREEYRQLVEMTRKICRIIKDELAKKDLELYDIKLEFARLGKDHHIGLIDEISAGNMRVYHKGRPVKPFELEKLLLA